MESAAVVKLITLGDTSVGKTSLILRFADNTFSSSHMPTIGIDSKAKVMTIGSAPIKVQLWDTAGQEKFRTISYSFYSRADGVLLVYDVTDRESLAHVAIWMSQILEKATKDVPVVLIGNKEDMAEGSDLEGGEEVAQRYRIPHFFTSAKTGKNVEEAVLTLVQEIVKRNPKAGAPVNKAGSVQVSPTLAPKISDTTACCK